VLPQRFKFMCRVSNLDALVLARLSFGLHPFVLILQLPPDAACQQKALMTLHGRLACILGGSLALLVCGALALHAWAVQPLLDTARAAQDIATEAAVRQALLRAGAYTTALAVAVGALGMAALHLLNRPLHRTLAELLSLAGRGRIAAGDVSSYEIEQLAGAVSSTVHELREDLSLRAWQLAELQRQTRDDPLTGLPLRHAFLGQLQGRLMQQRPGRCAILLLRVPQLEQLNNSLGREATDRLLGAIGHLLLTYVDRVHGAQAGRLNGSDFALFLPAGGVALETAHSLRDALGAILALRTASVCAVVGGVDGLPCISISAALAEADAALARAEAGEGEGMVVEQHADVAVAAAGATAWRAQIASALELGRLRLQEQRVVDRHGNTLHLACSPQLRLTPEEVFQPARLCVALARRSRLLAPLETATLRLALKATAADGVARCVRVGAPSLETPGFVADVAAALRAMPAQAAQLSIVMPWPESTHASTHALTAAAAAWRLAGARIGIESTSAAAHALAVLPSAGVGFVVKDAQLLHGVAADREAAEHAGSLFTLIRGLGLAVLADGDMNSDDLEAAWSMGLDGAWQPLPRPEEAASQQQFDFEDSNA
jgi:GGDEF domain-containing protein/EAL domain-containing protein (putative c-di-GMP-specific phosphodiesterase class I)